MILLALVAEASSRLRSTTSQIVEPIDGRSATRPVECTNDTLFGGRLRLTQPAKAYGYRVNVDALLLAGFAAEVFDRGSAVRYRHAVDLGAGVGAVGLSLLHLGAAERVTLIELDPGLSELSRTNARDNGFDPRVTTFAHDLATGLPSSLASETIDLVVCNPPYVPPGRGRPPLSVRERSRMGDLDVFVRAARASMGRRAYACFVYPAIEAITLFAELRACGLEPKRLRFVHAKPNGPARVVLVACAAAKPGGLVVESPFVETNDDGTPSAALSALLAR